MPQPDSGPAQEHAANAFWDGFPSSLDPELTTSPGRPQSIPPWAWPEVFRLREQGLGYRRVASALLSLKVWTTKSSVERLVRGKPLTLADALCGRKSYPRLGPVASFSPSACHPH